MTAGAMPAGAAGIAGGARARASNARIIRRLLTHMRPFRWIMCISLSARVTRIVSQAAVLGIAAASVGIYVAAHEPGAVLWDVIWTQVQWIAAAGVVVGVASYIEQYTGHYVAFHILAAFRNTFYYAMLPLAPARTTRLQSGDAVSRVMSDCERIEPFYAHTIAPAVAAILVPAAILAWTWTVHPSLVAVLTPFYLATTFLLPWLVAKLGGDGVAYREQLGQVNAFVADSIQGVRDTVAFGYEKRRGRELWRIGATMQAGQDKLYGADATQRALGEIFVTAGILAAAWWGIALALDGEISVLIELPAVIAVSVIGFYTSIGLANNYTDFRVSIIAARRLFAMMDEPPAVRESPDAASRAVETSSLHFRDVTFEYDSGDAGWRRGSKVLEDFSLDIGAGRHVALVGPSGTGKSTLIHLLLRHWDVQGGGISLGDRAAFLVFPAGAAGAVRGCFAAQLHLQRNGPRQHPVRPSRRLGGGDGSGGARRGTERVDRHIAARVRIAGRRAGRQVVRRPAPAHRHRPRDPQGCADRASR